MLTELYTIYDSKALIYNKPFHQQNEAVALRTASDLANDPNSECCKHAEDYVLFYLGTYDDQTTEMNLQTAPKSIARFHELKQSLATGGFDEYGDPMPKTQAG